MQKILVIDDDRDMCLLLKRFLSKNGYEVEEANTTKKALELLLRYAIFAWTIWTGKPCW